MNEVTGQISVTGYGSAAAPPDVAIVTAGVEITARSVAAARTQAAADAAAVIDSLRSGGIGESDLATTAYSVHPEYDHRNGKHLRGYRVTNSVEARVRNLESLGQLLDAVIAAGGDSTVINGIRFVHEDTTALDTAARTKAWQDARRKATQLAELAGVGLGKPTFVDERAHPSPMPSTRHATLESAAATPVEVGELGVSVTITAGFAIAARSEKKVAKTNKKPSQKKSSKK